MGNLRFPKKTKIAAWLMMATGIVILISSVLGFFMSVLEGGLHGHPMFVNSIAFIMGLLSILFIPFAIFVLRRKKWAWIIAVLLLFILIICFLPIIKFDYPEYKECIIMEWIRYDFRGGYIEPRVWKLFSDGTTAIFKCGKDLTVLPESRAVFDTIFGVILLPPLYIIPQIQSYRGTYSELAGLIIRITLLFVFILLPLSLFLCDRKKYWKITS